MDDDHWRFTFRQLWDKAVAQYAAGQRAPAGFFTQTETEFLTGLGCSTQELFDFAEDWCRYQAPIFDTVVAVTAVRREYFREVQQATPTGRVGSMSELPVKTAAVAGYEWLPRLIAKARLKLRGEMPADLMYGCGGDRAFFQRTNVDPAEFRRIAWRAGAVDQPLIDYVTRCATSR